MKIRFGQIEGGRDLLGAIAAKCSDRRALNVKLGDRAVEVLQAHFALRNSEPNKTGFAKQGFWDRIAASTLLGRVDARMARINVTEPAINQKIYGGTITPKHGKYLALPAIAEAYGHSPLDFNFLTWRPGRTGGALVEAERTHIKVGRQKKDGTRSVKNKGEGWGGRVWYWLVKSVTQDADPNALPTEAEMQDALLDEAGEFLERMK